MTPPAFTPQIVKRIFLTMGTQVSVTLALEESRSRSDAEAALDQVELRIEQFGRDAWAWGDGRLAQLNRALASGEEVTLPTDLLPLFRHAWEIRNRTGGLYEPRIAALVRLWSFHDAAELGTAPPPAHEVQALLADLLAAPDYEGGERYGPAPNIGWDFGGIGKGYIVDAALNHLRELGYPNAIIDAGGNLAARGIRGDRRWHVGIRDPRVAPEHGVLLASLDVQDETVNTHGDDQRSFEHEGRRYGHILDPRSGVPVDGLRALTVIHADGCVAEAEGAALFVAGDPGWRDKALGLGLNQVLAMTADGRLQASASLAARLHTQPGIQIEVID